MEGFHLSRQPKAAGFTASVLLLIVYFSIVTLAESFEHALTQFREFWIWISLLIVGFGVQVGLYTYIRTMLRAREIAGATKSVATAAGVSTTSMVACCAHHLTDVVAIIGLTAVSAVLAKYQLFFIVFGILSNFVGITMMLEIIQRHGLGTNLFGAIMKLDMGKVKYSALYLSLFLLSFSFFTTYWSPGATTATVQAKPASQPSVIPEDPTTLSPLSDNQEGIEFIVTPTLSREGAVFNIGINTHSGSLDFDLTEVSLLRDVKGNEYLPTSWEGSPPGGHHRKGTLLFPPVNGGGELTLIITGFGSKERVFTWDIKE